MGAFLETMKKIFYVFFVESTRKIESAYDNNCNNVLVEIYSSLVVLSFRLSGQVPWPQRNRWQNMLHLLRIMNYIVSHIFKEGNQVADIIANKGLSMSSIRFWQDDPLFIKKLM